MCIILGLRPLPFGCLLLVLAACGGAKSSDSPAAGPSEVDSPCPDTEPEGDGSDGVGGDTGDPSPPESVCEALCEDCAWPQEELWTFASSDYWTLVERIGMVSAGSEEAVAESERVKEELLAALPAEDGAWTVGLTLASPATMSAEGWVPYLAEEGGSVVTGFCVGQESGVTCQALTARQGEAAPSPARPAGVCTTLATAYSLTFKLGLVPEGDAIREDGCTWEESHLDWIKEQQRYDPARGTPPSQVPRAYEALGATCGEQVFMPETGDPSGWCTDLETLNRDHDCTLFVRGTTATGRWGHAMHITAVAPDGGVCRVNTVDSSIQAQRAVLPGTQQWVMTGTAATTIVSQVPKGNVQSSNARFFNSLAKDEVAYICCK